MSRLYVQLGRSGDVINILPMLWADAQKGEKPRLLVAKEYAPLLEGCSYVQAIPFEGGAHELERAMAQARDLDPDYICTQVNGPVEVCAQVYERAGRKNAMTTSWAKEQWALAGRLAEFGDHPLVFDRRNPEREAELFERCHIGSKKFVLVAADGISSPFPHRELLFALMEDRIGLQVIDVTKTKVDRLFDLLALYEKAHALVAIDSAPLHLANAAPNLPVFALTRDKPILWNGSPWRGNHAWYCRYSEFPARAAELFKAVKASQRLPRTAGVIAHVYNAMRGDVTPAPMGKYWCALPIVAGIMGRLGPTETEQHPFVKDVVKMGIQKAGPGGWVCLSRPGLTFSDNAADILMTHETCFAYRLQGGQFSPVGELFFAKSAWWREQLDKIPTVLYLANDVFWSQALWAIFKAAGANDVTGLVTREAPKVAKQPGTASQSTRINQAGRTSIFQSLKITGRYPRVSEQIETLPLNLKQLFQGGYNPTIIDTPSGMLMAYRFHPDTNPRTKIALARLDTDQKSVVANEILLGGDNSVEDPRFITSNLLSFVDSTWPTIPPKSVVKLAVLKGFAVDRISHIEVEQNDYSRIQKNFVHWDNGHTFIYTTSPEQVIYTLAGAHRTPGPRWAYGDPRGGTPPVEYEGHWLRFFHSSLRNEFEGASHRYYLGAYLMKKSTPFEVARVSRKPIVFGSEIDDLKVSERPHHWKANIVFCSGIITNSDHWVLSCGINDSSCLLAKITEKDLNL